MADTVNTPTVTTEDIAEERSIVLHLTGAPTLTDYFGTAITPSGVWIDYRRVAGEPFAFQRAHVSGFRTVSTGDEARDFTSITLLAGPDADTSDLPAWLVGLVADRTPTA